MKLEKIEVHLIPKNWYETQIPACLANDSGISRKAWAGVHVNSINTDGIVLARIAEALINICVHTENPNVDSSKIK